MNNTIKTTLLLTGLTLLLIFFGRMIGGSQGAFFAFVFACVMNFGAYWFSDKMVLAMTRATEISETEVPEIYEIVRKLAAKAELPMPRVYLIPSASPNAFATGRNPEHAVIAVSKGLIELLNVEELTGVIAHEMAHVEHRDILISSIAATLAGAISMLASMVRWAAIFGGGRRYGSGRDSNPVALIVMSLIMPLAAMFVQMAVSRSREYAADRKGAQLCGQPLYLASALRKIAEASGRMPMADTSPATAHLYIMSPLRGGLTSLFSTHPPIEERIARLERMAD